MREGEATFLSTESGAFARVGAAAIVLVAALAGGCGIGPGPASPGEATLTITRDYGSEPLKEVSETDPTQSETVIRFLDRESELDTRYGGGFVQSIDGLSGTVSGDRSFDWFFYVNGVESAIGAAEVKVRGGDRIWWDYRDWTEAMRVPAVVGSWPEPFLQRSTAAGEQLPVQVECAARPSSCRTVRDRLADEGVDSATVKPGEDDAEAMRIVVGPWSRIENSPQGRLIARGPSASGVFARFERSGIAPLDPRGEAGDALGPSAGLVAATHDGDDPPVWLVTGTDQRGVAEAAERLEPEDLRDRYAILVQGQQVMAAPFNPAGGPE